MEPQFGRREQSDERGINRKGKNENRLVFVVHFELRIDTRTSGAGKKQ